MVWWSDYYKKDMRKWFKTYELADIAEVEIIAHTKKYYPNMKQVEYKVVAN